MFDFHIKSLLLLTFPVADQREIEMSEEEMSTGVKPDAAQNAAEYI
jgi:hypothetical protein